jgi:hypothetical protein
VVYFLILRPVKKQAVAAFRELPGRGWRRPRPQRGAEPGGGSAAKPSRLGGDQRATQLKKMLTEKVKAEPAAASRLVESWVRGGE